LLRRFVKVYFAHTVFRLACLNISFLGVFIVVVFVIIGKVFILGET